MVIFPQIVIVIYQSHQSMVNIETMYIVINLIGIGISIPQAASTTANITASVKTSTSAFLTRSPPSSSPTSLEWHRR